MSTEIPSRPPRRPSAVVEHDLTPPPLIPALIARLAWPDYECELCVGQDYWAGCYCSWSGCTAPTEYPMGSRVPPWRQGLRAWAASLARPVYRLMARRTGHYPQRD